MKSNSPQEHFNNPCNGSLSEREMEILKLVCLGHPYKHVAVLLNICQETVKFHMKGIYKKTETNCIASLVCFSIKSGIISVD